MRDTPELFVYQVTHGVVDEGTGEDFGSVISTREPTVAEVVAWLQAQGAGKRTWNCNQSTLDDPDGVSQCGPFVELPEWEDIGGPIGHTAEGCGWVYVIREDTTNE